MPNSLISVEALQTAIGNRIRQYNLSDNPVATRSTINKHLLNSVNHVLAVSVKSSIAVPQQNVSAMDGYAIAKGSDLAENSMIEIIGESQAGKGFFDEIKAGQGVRIFTGAVVPSDCDTVIMQENIEKNTQTVAGTLSQKADFHPYTIRLVQAGNIKNNIRNQGEEIAIGETVLEAGKCLNASDISLLASIGVGKVTVLTPLKVGLIATGDELVALGNPLKSMAQIYNSNTPSLQALYANLPIEIVDYGITVDDLPAIRDTIKQATKQCDVVISTAGVSVGDYDYLTEVIEEVGQINHYKVAMKPGKPFVFGELIADMLDKATKPVLYFGLPGNPLSAVVGSLQFVIPALWQMSGLANNNFPKPFCLNATLQNDVKKSVGRTDFQRGFLTQTNNGSWNVEVFKNQQSHRVKQLSQANCLVVLDQESSNLQAGEQVLVQPILPLFC